MTPDQAIDDLLKALDARNDAEAAFQDAAAVVREAARVALDSGAGATEIARAAGVSRNAIYHWSR